MTASKLEESIEELAGAVFPINGPANMQKNIELIDALRTFAEAIRCESAGITHSVNCPEMKPPEPVHGPIICDKGPKECGCQHFDMTGTYVCHCHKPPALPAEVKERIGYWSNYIQRNKQHMGCLDIANILETFASESLRAGENK